MDSNDPSKVVFEGEELHHSAHSLQSKSPRMVQWIIDHSGGRIKNAQQAERVLIGFVVIAAIVSLLLVFGGGGKKLTSEERQFQTVPSETI